MAPRKKAEVCSSDSPPKAKVRRSAEVVPKVTNQLNGEPLKFTEEGEPLNFLDSKKDLGELPFNKREPLRVKYTLFGKEREEFDCGGMISSCIKPDEDGKVAVMTSVMGIADPEVLMMMLKGMVDHILEVVSKIEGVPGVPKPGVKDEKELLERMALSRMAVTDTFN